MIDRINLIMQAKNITPSQFADEINIQRSGMSHIMSGRNKPSLDFIMRVLKRYPEIDTDWLLFGKGEMYSTPLQASIVPEVLGTGVNLPQSVANKQTTNDFGGQMDMFATETRENNDNNSILETAGNEQDAKEAVLQVVETEDCSDSHKLVENDVNKNAPVIGHENATVEKKSRKAVRYLVFYSDHTFEEFLRAE